MCSTLSECYFYSCCFLFVFVSFVGLLFCCFFLLLFKLISSAFFHLFWSAKALHETEKITSNLVSKQVTLICFWATVPKNQTSKRITIENHCPVFIWKIFTVFRLSGSKNGILAAFSHKLTKCKFHWNYSFQTNKKFKCTNILVQKSTITLSNWNMY